MVDRDSAEGNGSQKRARRALSSARRGALRGARNSISGEDHDGTHPPPMFLNQLLTCQWMK